MSVESIRQSADFFGGPDSDNNYGPITLLPGGGVVDLCVDPRLRKGLSYRPGMVFAQNAGGLAGQGMDGALFLGAEEGVSASVDLGIALAQEWWPYDVAWVHLKCKNNVNVVGIFDEMANPSDPTLATMRRWAHRLDFPIVDQHAYRTKRSAGVLADLLRGTTIEQLAQPDSGHPSYDVVGPNESGVYVAVLEPGVGLRYDNRPADEEIQGYVDTVAHSTDRAEVAHGLNTAQRHLLAFIRLARAATTRTLLMRDHADNGYLFEMWRSTGGDAKVEQVGFE